MSGTSLNRILNAAIAAAKGDKETISRIECVEWAPHYSEPGYEDNGRGVVFSNWNNVQHRDPHSPTCWTDSNDVMERLSRILEKAGFSIEWSDEWLLCGGCQGAIRTSADCFFWYPSYYETNGDFLCRSCVEKDASDYIESIEKTGKPIPHNLDIDLGEYGKVLVSEHVRLDYAPGVSEPRPVKNAMEKMGYEGVVFRLKDVTDTGMVIQAWANQKEEGE